MSASPGGADIPDRVGGACGRPPCLWTAQISAQIFPEARTVVCDARPAGSNYTRDILKSYQLSLSSFQGSTCSPFAIRAMLSMETFRSDRSTPLR
jgi:hypothetical protein